MSGANGWGHDELAADLMDARHMVGEIAIERLGIRGGQLDVASLRLSWSDPRPTGYEIKISRADFQSDIRSGKWRKYLLGVERLYFCVPAGLVKKNEVPPECGLMYRNEHHWYTVKAPHGMSLERLRERQNALHLFAMAILFRHYPAVWQFDTREVVDMGRARRAADAGGATEGET